MHSSSRSHTGGERASSASSRTSTSSTSRSTTDTAIRPAAWRRRASGCRRDLRDAPYCHVALALKRLEQLWWTVRSADVMLVIFLILRTTGTRVSIEGIHRSIEKALHSPQISSNAHSTSVQRPHLLLRLLRIENINTQEASLRASQRRWCAQLQGARVAALQGWW